MDLSNEKHMEESASSTITDAGKEEKLPICEKCGQPSERKKRGDNTWYLYPLCRKCRKEAPSKEEKPEEPEENLVITDKKLLFLLMQIYRRLWVLKHQDWQGAPKETVLGRLKMLVAVVEED